MMTTPDIPALEGIVIERKYTTVGDLVKKLQVVDPDLYVALNDSEYGYELKEIYIVSATLGPNHPIERWQREETGLKSGDRIIQLC